MPWNTIATVVSGGSSSFGVNDGRPSSRTSSTATCSSAETISADPQPRRHAGGSLAHGLVAAEELLQHGPVTRQ